MPRSSAPPSAPRSWAATRRRCCGVDLSVSEAATGTGIGQPVRRREDLRLITGQGRYTDDLKLPGQAYAAMVRSPHAHAVLRAIDTTAAKAVPGVLAVLTGKDWIA